MTTDSGAPASAAAEILRLRQQLAAREEVITALNRRVLDLPDDGYHEDPEPDQDALADAIMNGRALQAELQQAREVVAQQKSEIVALRHQLGVYDRMGVSSAVGGMQKVWALLRGGRGGRS
jgi:hypothetical protein